jgi:hypothetical protein
VFDVELVEMADLPSAPAGHPGMGSFRMPPGHPATPDRGSAQRRCYVAAFHPPPTSSTTPPQK